MMTLSPTRVLAMSALLACGTLFTAGCSSDSADPGAAASSAAAVATSAASAAASSAEEAAEGAASSAGAVASSAVAAASSVAASATGGNGAFTLAEVQQHATSGDCWTAIDGKVYDLTTWEDKHPGGAERIVSLCGTDGTAAFTAQHNTQEEPNETLAEYQIGTLS
ncbi:MAG: hypothetical protein QG597_5000 [Actinomycetota bacterium]|nr:hypothetical protein [Actinomycetota bacterium]